MPSRSTPDTPVRLMPLFEPLASAAQALSHQVPPQVLSDLLVQLDLGVNPAPNVADPMLAHEPAGLAVLGLAARLLAGGPQLGDLNRAVLGVAFG